MGAGFSEKGLLVVQAKTKRQRYLEENMPALTDVGREDLAYTCMHLGVQVLKTMHWQDAVRHMKYLNSAISQYSISKTHLCGLPWKKRLHLQMIRYLFVPVCFLHSI